MEGSSSSVASGSSDVSSNAGTSASTSSSSSQSSIGSGANERNKRARSEGPERSSDNDEQHAPMALSDGFPPPSLPEIRPLSTSTFTSDFFPPQVEAHIAPTVDNHDSQSAGSRPTPHGLRADLSQATYSGSYLNLLPPRLSSPVPQPRPDEDFSMRDVAPRRVPTEVHEENVRHVLERAEAFDISIAPLRSDPPELLQRGDYLVSSPGSNEDVDSLRAGG